MLKQFKFIRSIRTLAYFFQLKQTESSPNLETGSDSSEDCSSNNADPTEGDESGFEDQKAVEPTCCSFNTAVLKDLYVAAPDNQNENEHRRSLLLSAFSVPTQRLKMNSLCLLGKLGTGFITKLPLVITCLKCKSSLDWVFNLPGGNQITTASPDTLFLSMGPYHAKCHRCSQNLSMSFRAEHFSNFKESCGTISLIDCTVSSIPDQQADMMIQCSDCNVFTRLKKFSNAILNQTLCSNCNALMGFEYSTLSIGPIVASTKQMRE
ncbi:hypothetical protein Ciccas_000301 [Cichlidogyrus casuarinus]|uniref:Uncharacterized protein n=1 Tax=Cichlidogyrus casuarinus TaxID=1844966 RepID=A0ABD2QNB0_9PLAT